MKKYEFIHDAAPEFSLKGMDLEEMYKALGLDNSRGCARHKVYDTLRERIFDLINVKSKDAPHISYTELQQYKEYWFYQDKINDTTIYEPYIFAITQLNYSYGHELKYLIPYSETGKWIEAMRLLKCLMEDGHNLRHDVKITSSNTFDELEGIINRLNELYTLKGQYGNIIDQIEEVEKTLKSYKQELAQIDNDLFADDYQEKVDTQLSRFNAIFADISEELYEERYAVKYDIKTGTNGQRNYKFSVIGTNLSSGKKQGEISCFDIAYTIFADNEGIPCLHFILNDKKELVHDHQLIKLAEIANRENVQFVASMLKDKLPEQMRRDEYYVVELFESDKLFRI